MADHLTLCGPDFSPCARPIAGSSDHEPLRAGLEEGPASAIDQLYRRFPPAGQIPDTQLAMRDSRGVASRRRESLTWADSLTQLAEGKSAQERTVLVDVPEATLQCPLCRC
jgi:hypothetical protein